MVVNLVYGDTGVDHLFSRTFQVASAREECPRVSIQVADGRW